MPLHNDERFAVFLRTLYRQNWVVYAKPPFDGPEHVLHYLARYTHRVAISDHRLLSVLAAEACFRWKDYAHHGKQRTLTLAPKSSCAASYSTCCHEAFPYPLLRLPRQPQTSPHAALLHKAAAAETPLLAKPSLWKCPRCHGASR